MIQESPGDIVVELSAPQTAVLESRAAVILDMSGQGGGKSQNIGYSSGMFVSEFPDLLGFIGANTYLQLSQSTLVSTFRTWKKIFGFTEWDLKANRNGAYVVDKKPPSHFTRRLQLRDYSGTISFYNGALIFLGSLDNYKAHEGKEFAWAHLDETKDTKEAALKEVIIARLRQYGLWHDAGGNLLYDPTPIQPEEAEARSWTAWNPIYIHTSPALMGVEWLNKMFKLEAFEKDIKREVMKKERGFFNVRFDNKEVVIYSVHHNQDNLPPNYISNQESNLIDEDKILKMVYAYPFGKAGGEYFPKFRKDHHVGPVSYIPGQPVHQTWDFNAVPYMTCVLSQLNYVIKFIDQVGTKHLEPGAGRTPMEVMIIQFYKEYCFASPRNSTEAVGEQFMQEHDAVTTEIFYYGDCNGLHRIPGMGSYTNFKAIEDQLFAYLHNQSKRVKDPNVAPLKRRDLLNKIFAGKFPEIEILIDPEGCPETVRDFENVKIGKNGEKHKKKIKDENGGVYEQYGHTSDAVEYEVSELCKNYLYE